MKTMVVRMGGFNFVDVKVPVVVLRNPRWFRHWFHSRGFVTMGVKPCACQFAADWGKPWHTTPVVWFVNR